MERLTEEHNGMVWLKSHYGGLPLNLEPHEIYVAVEGASYIRRILQRLTAYEDTGLEPEEVMALATAEEKRKTRLADMKVGKTLDGVSVGLVLPCHEYIEREAAIKVIRSKAEVYEIGQGDALEGLYVADCEIGGLPSDDVVSEEEFALLEAKNEVLGQENDRLKAENKRLHEENFWLTGHKGQEKEEEKPLTLEELRELDGQPVWVSYEDRTGGEWGIVQGTIIYLPAGEYCSIREEGFGEYWKAYRHPPKEEA